MKELLIGLVGALIGASASIITVLIQTNAQTQQERLRSVQLLALEEFKCALELAKNSGGGIVPPVTVYLTHHLHLAKIVEKKGKITAEDLEALNIETEKILEKVNTFGKKKK